MNKSYLRVLFCLLLFFSFKEVIAQCGASTPSFVVTLTAAPNSTYTSPNTTRADTCCGGIVAGECVKFVITLHPQSMGINFGFASGAVPPGSLFYQINCDTTKYTVGQPICLDGAGPHTLTFCKPGGNANTYSITSIPKPQVPDSVLVRNGCTQTLVVTGYSVPTITWTAVPANTLYTSFLSCTVGCATVVVTPTGTALPPSVKYLVSGYGQSPCQSSFYQDTIEVFFYNDLQADINPKNLTLCYGQNSAVLTVTASGGLGPYTYSWTTGSTSNSVTVGPGTYIAYVYDNTGCPPTSDTATVGSFTLPITAIASPDYTLCNNISSAPINGTVISASGGVWSGGSGFFTPSTTTLNVFYHPTLSEVTTGSVQIYLSTTGNAGCPPDQDTVVIRFQPPPQIVAVPDQTVCGNNALTNLSSTISGFPASATWSTTSTGTFSSPQNTVTTFMPSAADISNGTVQVVVTSTNNGYCPPDADTVLIIITPKPVVNSGSSQTICSTSSATLNGNIGGATFTGSWSTSGNGTFNPNNTVLNAAYVPGPLDISTGSVSLYLTSTNNNNCLAEKDTVIIYILKQATVNAGTNLQLCATINQIPINGTVTGVTSTGTWFTSGSGNFSPGPNTVSNNTYMATSADAQAGTIIFTLTSTNNGPCPAVSDTVMIRFQNLPVVSAGSNSVICSSQNTISLQGNITTSPPSGIWNTSGTGGFSPSNTSLVTSYSMTSADINLGTVTFSLTSTNNGICPAVTDSVMFTILIQPTVSAGPNVIICSTTSTINLSGQAGGAPAPLNWSTTGSGMISNPGTPSSMYTLGGADAGTGTVIFTLATANGGICPAVSDTMMLRIITNPTVSAGTHPAVCATQSVINLAGSITGAAGTVSWTTSGTGSFNAPGALAGPYFFSAGDVNTGILVFTITSTANGPCPAAKDTMMIRIVKSATVNAGPDQNICSSASNINLSGTIFGLTSTGLWTSSNSSGIFPGGSTNLSTTYQINATDLLNGIIVFTLSSTNNGPCPAVEDTLVVRIDPLAIVNSGGNRVICSSTRTIDLSGSVSAPFTASWSASGGGVFNPGNSVLNPTYTLSDADINNGFVNYTLTSMNNKSCPPVSDSVRITVQRQATANAGPDQTICSNQQGFTLAGSVTGITSTGLWSTSGSGSISPSNNALGGVYSLSPADISSGNVQMILLTTNNGVCPPDSDTASIRIILYPTVFIKQDTSICVTPFPLLLDGHITGGSGAIQWTTNGTGSFVPNNYSLPASYVFGPGDVTMGEVNIRLSSVNNGQCGNVGSTLKVTALPSPLAAFSASQYSITIPSDPIIFTNESQGGKTYKWLFGDNNVSTLFNPSHLYNEVGYYDVELITVNQYGCSDTATRRITAISDVLFPNAFTPNPNGPNGGYYSKGDYATNLNDVFFPYTGGVVEYELMIFNRWGELLFRSDDLNRGWDGYFNGQLCQQDAYVWKANVKFFDGRTFNKAGSVTLLR